VKRNRSAAEVAERGVWTQVLKVSQAALWAPQHADGCPDARGLDSLMQVPFSLAPDALRITGEHWKTQLGALDPLEEESEVASEKGDGVARSDGRQPSATQRHASFLRGVSSLQRAGDPVLEGRSVPAHSCSLSDHSCSLFDHSCSLSDHFCTLLLTP
jgi:hypothetical protein